MKDFRGAGTRRTFGAYIVLDRNRNSHEGMKFIAATPYRIISPLCLHNGPILCKTYIGTDLIIDLANP